MFDVPPLHTLGPQLIGIDGAAAIVVEPPFASPMPVTPADRAKLYASVAYPTILALNISAQTQRGIDPVFVIASADAPIGRSLIERRFGSEILVALTGPIVLDLTDEEAVALLGRERWGVLAAAFDAIGTKDGARVLLAVNAGTVEARVLRMVASNALPLAIRPEAL